MASSSMSVIARSVRPDLVRLTGVDFKTGTTVVINLALSRKSPELRGQITRYTENISFMLFAPAGFPFAEGDVLRLDWDEDESLGRVVSFKFSALADATSWP